MKKKSFRVGQAVMWQPNGPKGVIVEVGSAVKVRWKDGAVGVFRRTAWLKIAGVQGVQKRRHGLRTGMAAPMSDRQRSRHWEVQMLNQPMPNRKTHPDLAWRRSSFTKTGWTRPMRKSKECKHEG
jgi:hypothetical protein